MTKIMYKNHRLKCVLCDNFVPPLTKKIFETQEKVIICFCNAACFDKWKFDQFLESYHPTLNEDEIYHDVAQAVRKERKSTKPSVPYPSKQAN